MMTGVLNTKTIEVMQHCRNATQPIRLFDGVCHNLRVAAGGKLLAGPWPYSTRVCLGMLELQRLALGLTAWDYTKTSNKLSICIQSAPKFNTRLS
jgi:hypothetical protein